MIPAIIARNAHEAKLAAMHVVAASVSILGLWGLGPRHADTPTGTPVRPETGRGRGLWWGYRVD